MSETGRKSISIEELLALEEQEEPLVPSQEEDTKKYTSQELKKAKRENKHYLPVLHINDPLMWPSKPNSERRHFTDKAAAETCLTNCCGVPGLWSACCRLDPDDIEHVLGPVSEKWIKRILRHFRKKGYNWKRNDIVIDYEEGKLIGDKFFNGHPVFSKQNTYPILRIQAIGPRFGCKFLNPDNGMCGIYEHRPEMCRGYYCQYVKTNFLVRTKEHPNTYKRVDVRKDKKEDEF